MIISLIWLQGTGGGSPQPFDLLSFIPLAVTVAASAVVLGVLYGVTRRAKARTLTRGVVPQLSLFFAGLLSLVAIVIALPIEQDSQGQILSFLGILFSAAIALGSTTLLSNSLAGFMLRSSRSFKIGDFLEVSGHFGRVTETGLFHIEVQTEDRDLVTLPNLHLASNPYKVVYSTGTIVSASLSLGYDVSRERVEECLLAAASECELQEPFVQVLELGDFAVTYRIAGLLEDVKHLLSTRSRLRKRTMDALHNAGIEIVSPTFINQRVFAPDKTFLSRSRPGNRAQSDSDDAPDRLAFDKADEAQEHERLKQELEDTLVQLEEKTTQRSGESDESRRDILQLRVDLLEERKLRLENQIAAAERRLDT